MAPLRHRALAYCHGFTVDAGDQTLGKVETPLFPPDGVRPDFLVVQTAGAFRGRRPVVPAILIEDVDVEQRRIRVRGGAAEIAGLPEHLPLALHPQGLSPVQR